MRDCDYTKPWYHGSPETLSVLRKGSWVTQFEGLAKGFSHWQTQRDLAVRLVADLPIDDPPQLTDEEIAELRKRMSEGTTGMICDPD